MIYYYCGCREKSPTKSTRFVIVDRTSEILVFKNYRGGMGVGTFPKHELGRRNPKTAQFSYNPGQKRTLFPVVVSKNRKNV